MRFCLTILVLMVVLNTRSSNAAAQGAGTHSPSTRAAGADGTSPLRERWEAPYQGDDVNGAEILGLWTFDGDQPLRDASRHNHPSKLEGAQLDSDGRFGACLRSFRGWPVEDQRHRLRVPHASILSPRGPFTVELWVNADKALTDYPEAFLVDKKYVADTDYQFTLSRPDRSGLRSLQVRLGFGTHSAAWNSDPFTLAPGTWYHVAFSYDAAGTVRFFVDGVLWGSQQVAGVGRVSGGSHPLSIGDRIGSLFHGFPGRIDQVRICAGARDFRPARLERVSDRTNFLRMEKDVQLQFLLRNLDHQPMKRAEIRWSVDGMQSPPVQIEQIESGAVRELVYQLDSTLRPGHYQLEATYSWGDTPKKTLHDRSEFRILPRRNPHAFPVVMWGADLSATEELKELGFTHALGVGADYQKIWNAGAPTAPAAPDKLLATRRALDQALGEGVSFAASLSPGSHLRRDPSLHRIDRKQRPYAGREDICGLFPNLGKYCYNVGQSVAQAYGDLPAFNAALLHTEVRDAARPCFHAHDVEAYRSATGLEIPAQVTTKWGVDYHKLDNFPVDRVIRDDHPLYRYYLWYWKRGDGWNDLNDQLHRGLQTMNRPDFWTWHDPAVRVASVWGAGGDVDVLSQWTYSYPDPIRIGVATDELLAMARGARGDQNKRAQQVMKMTQVIWYRSQTAPQTKSNDQATPGSARWEREQPDAPFITIAPMHLREAFWTKISRPINGIMYHGWQSLVPIPGRSGYRYTHSETGSELARLIRTVIKPLGPCLRTIPAIESDVAFYESFAAQVFAGRGTYGWSGKWLGDAHLISQWAGLQSEIVFDETIQQHGLGPYKVLFMMDCDVVTRGVADKILEFQNAGGIVIGDANTTPAITPDILLPIFQRSGHADKDKEGLVAIARQLRSKLAGRYTNYVDSDNRDVIVYRRRVAETDYLFLINDHRDFGSYVGQHGRVMEDGLPSAAAITVGRPNAFVYDLVRHKEIASRSTDGGRSIQVKLGPCEGRLLMVADQAIQAVDVRAPESLVRGRATQLLVRIIAADGEPLRATVPVQLTIEDAETRQAEFSGYWAAENGVLQVPLHIATNDPTGAWTITARELASGRSATVFMHVTGNTSPAAKAKLDSDAANPVQPDG